MISIFNYNNLKNSYLILFLLVNIFLVFSNLQDILHINAYRHDSLYDLSCKFYFKYKVLEEGRWLNCILFPITSLLSGKLLSISILFLFSYFIYYISKNITDNIYISLLISMLFFQIPPLYNQILWPATSILAVIVLLSSIHYISRLPLYKFYIVYGILFFGTLSNLYYLLPLAHISVLAKNQKKIDYKTILFNIIPLWAIGFIVGYLTTQIIVFVLSGGHMMKISEWRQPHYIHSLEDLYQNFLHSFNSLKNALNYIFSKQSILFTYIMAIILAFIGSKKHPSIPLYILFFSIIIVHYVIILPIGIVISPRTIIATWVGVFAIGFLIPHIKKWQIVFLTPIITLFAFTFYLENQKNLNWYNTITHYHYNKLSKISPKEPSSYEGLVLLGSDKDITNINNNLSKKYNLKPIRIESLNGFMRWDPIAHELGFKTVIMCNKTQSVNDLLKKTVDAQSVCKQIYKKFKYKSKKNLNYSVLGEYQNLLIIAL